MELVMAELPAKQRGKVLVSTVTPRPIAWVTTVSPAGVVNAAPYSFFNVMGDDPPTLVLGLMRRPDRTDKDTATNIIATGEFVVSLVSEADAETMNLSSAPAPAEVSEIAYAGIATAPARLVRPPLIATAPVSFECRMLDVLEYGPSQVIAVGEVLVAHIKDEFVLDAEKLYLDTPAMKLIGRVHGAGMYVRTSDQFEMPFARYDPARAG